MANGKLKWHGRLVVMVFTVLLTVLVILLYPICYCAVRIWRFFRGESLNTGASKRRELGRGYLVEETEFPTTPVLWCKSASGVGVHLEFRKSAAPGERHYITAVGARYDKPGINGPVSTAGLRSGRRGDRSSSS